MSCHLVRITRVSAELFLHLSLLDCNGKSDLAKAIDFQMPPATKPAVTVNGSHEIGRYRQKSAGVYLKSRRSVGIS